LSAPRSVVKAKNFGECISCKDGNVEEFEGDGRLPTLRYKTRKWTVIVDVV
jgi:hypothetical protein